MSAAPDKKMQKSRSFVMNSPADCSDAGLLVDLMRDKKKSPTSEEMGLPGEQRLLTRRYWRAGSTAWSPDAHGGGRDDG